jgi:hypothetical protein
LMGAWLDRKKRWEKAFKRDQKWDRERRTQTVRQLL